MKILYLPLDERPCNYLYPQMIAGSSSIELTTPSLEILPSKKVGARYEDIRDYLVNNISNHDGVVIALDMLLYGGLIPSRLHHLDIDKVKERLEVLKELKELNPDVKIYAFECIMRCPQYNSSEEEPDYYEDYGYALFKKRYLEDKQERVGLSEQEEIEYSQLVIPDEVVHDYEERRKVNCLMNQITLDYLADGTIDFMVIPQDDSSPFGYTAIDQKIILKQIKEKHLELKTMVYPGADEVGLTLMCRCYHDYHHLTPTIYPFYASTLGPSIVPLYEDRPMYESLKSHILACGARIVDDSNHADLVLGINCPGKFMQESFVDKDVTYSSYRNLLEFVYRIESYVNSGRSVAVIDSAFSNGGDYELIRYLDELDLLDQLKGYAGWNTNCNTTGTVLAQALLGNNGVANTIYHIIEDCFYQAIVRQDVIEHDLVELGLSYYDFKDLQGEVEDRISAKLLALYQQLKLSKQYPIEDIDVYMPWHRMFEIGMKFK